MQEIIVFNQKQVALIFEREYLIKLYMALENLLTKFGINISDEELIANSEDPVIIFYRSLYHYTKESSIDMNILRSSNMLSEIKNLCIKLNQTDKCLSDGLLHSIVSRIDTIKEDLKKI